MDLYKRVLKLEYLDFQYKDKWVVCPGAFHMAVCALRCLGKTIEGSGIDEAWVEAEVYSSVTMDQIINGNHYRRALEAQEVTLQVLFDLWIEAFFSERPAVQTSLEACIKQVSKACVLKQGVHEAHFSLIATLESINIDKQLNLTPDMRHIPCFNGRGCTCTKSLFCFNSNTLHTKEIEETNLFKLMTKEIIPKPIEESILSMEACGSSVMKKFFEERISGETNLWEKMTKSKFLSWNSSGKEIKLQAKSEVITLRTTTGLMSRPYVLCS
ncbi:Hypothetical predicted protein [Paramuricea clavata]|uniref:Uncharacterized protein n=1 Tax=Paramuricea clavata TaxID=317549 RepID=A0A6S7FTM9_PARCT|nr:Hypothetical predicted protein [Paramuricea clavata]